MRITKPKRQQDASRQPNLPVTIDGKAYAEQLVSLEGKSLFSEFDQFWAQCEQANNFVRYNYRN
ncbi:hypothetical protein OH492_27065 [Vibrio chagasii]|nr:hypothetical protein [Vibrio chagasii]